MNRKNTFHLSTSAAEAYESQKVPSVFAPLATATLDALTLPATSSVLDIACGTGIIPKLISNRLTSPCRIVGTDLNPAMLEVADRTMPPSPHTVEWFAADVTELPFGDGEFDIAFCQQGLQFFPDKPAALAEIRRVLVPGGRLVLTCWRAVSPLFQAVSDSLGLRLSEKSSQQALAPFAFRDGDVIADLLAGAGFRDVELSALRVRRALVPARPAIREEILASPYEGELRAAGDHVIDLVVADVESALRAYREGNGLVIPQEAHLFVAARPAGCSPEPGSLT